MKNVIRVTFLKTWKTSLDLHWMFQKKDGTPNCHQIEGNITWLTLINRNEAVDLGNLGVPHSQTSPTCGSCPRPQAIPCESPFAKVGNLKDVVREPGTRLGFTIRPAGDQPQNVLISDWWMIIWLVETGSHVFWLSHTFPSLIGNGFFSSQLTNSVHHFSEG